MVAGQKIVLGRIHARQVVIVHVAAETITIDLGGDTRTALRELMDRMGHSSPRAPLIYLHGSDARQRAIADGLSELAGPELRKRKTGRLVAVHRANRARGGHERPWTDHEGSWPDDLEVV